VDVVGLSMGGLAARYAACPPSPDLAARSTQPVSQKRLKIARLFTISSPHAGALLAEKAALVDFHRDMRPDSAFLKYVASCDAEARYELFCYVYLNDEIVGAQYAAPAGKNPYWLTSAPTVSPHIAAMLDDRILADIARRLRGETPMMPWAPDPLPATPVGGGE